MNFIQEGMTLAEAEGPTAPGRLERRKARTRAAILEAASSLFQEQGYESTAIQQIAERADTGVGTLYGYFASKEAILVEVLRAHSEDAVERYYAAIRPETPAIDRVCTGLATFADYIRENRAILMAAFQVAARERRIDDQPTDWLVSAYTQILKEGIESGELKPVPIDSSARLLLGSYMQAMLGIGVWHGRGRDPQTLEDLETLTRAMLTG